MKDRNLVRSTKQYPFSHNRRTYCTWRGLIYRVTKVDLYLRNGIKIDSRWLDFSVFVRDLGLAPQGMCLDRIDTHGNYAPGNCRWVTQKENARNARDNHVINGQCISAWAETVGVHPNTVLYRIKRGSKDPFSSDTRRTKSILCVETGIIYPSFKEAALATGADATAITRCLKTPHYTSTGFHWVLPKKEDSK